MGGVIKLNDNAFTLLGLAIKHGRQAILCELNPDYAELMPERVFSIAGLPVNDNDDCRQLNMLEILEGSA